MRALWPTLTLFALTGCFTPTVVAAYDAGPQPVACSPACGETEVCIDGACLPRTCERVQCLTGSTCVRGRCYPTTCSNSACSAGQVCAANRCVETACAGVSCAFGTCIDGGCPSCSALEFFSPDAGGCVPKLTAGAGCDEGTQCASGFCTSGVCCDRPCDEACEECGTGRCTLRAALDPGGPPQCFPGRCSGRARRCATSCIADGDCAEGAFCKAGLSCEPVLDDGATCSRDTMCRSGHCAGGVCCASACSGPCMSCAAMTVGDAGYPAGLCHPVPPNWSTACAPLLCQSDRLGCPAVCAGDSTCMTPNFCDDDGGCTRTLGLAVACTRNAQCVSGNCRNGRCCVASCTGACTDCLPDGTCQSKPDGLADAGCSNNGVCAQGVCCDRDCRGQCERCDVFNRVGTCSGVYGAQYTCNTLYTCIGDAGCSTTCGGSVPCSDLGFCNTARVCEPRCDDLVCIQTYGPTSCCGADNRCHSNQPCVEY